MRSASCSARAARSFPLSSVPSSSTRATFTRGDFPSPICSSKMKAKIVKNAIGTANVSSSSTLPCHIRSRPTRTTVQIIL
jgi:hypothetical protein